MSIPLEAMSKEQKEQKNKDIWTEVNEPKAVSAPAADFAHQPNALSLRADGALLTHSRCMLHVQAAVVAPVAPVRPVVMYDEDYANLPPAETFTQRLWSKCKREPLIPIGQKQQSDG